MSTVQPKDVFSRLLIDLGGIVAALAVLLGAWTLVSITGVIPRIYLPPFWQVAAAAWADRLPLSAAIGVTLKPGLIGYVLGFVFGLLVGFPLGRYRAFREWCGPSLDGLRAIPSIVLIPAALLVLKNHVLVTIFAVAWACFFLTSVNISRGSARSLRLLEEVIRSFGGTEWDRVTKAGLPSLVPYAMASLRQNVGVMLLVAVVTDMVLGISGLGYYLLSSEGATRYDQMYAAVVALMVLGFVAYRLFTLLDGWVAARWMQDRASIEF